MKTYNANRTRHLGSLLLAAGLLSTGCSLAPDYQRPAFTAPNAWSEPATDQGEASATLDWHLLVEDAQLQARIKQALAHNRDLRQALLNVEMARATYRVQRADRLPGLQVQGDSTRQRQPADINRSDRASIDETHQFGLGLTAFELDLFGRLRNLSRAAQYEYLASEDNARNVRISLIAEVIQAHVGFTSASQRQLLAEQTLDSRQASLQLVEQRKKSGTATELDYQEALELREQALAERQRSERERRQAGHALARLTGQAPPQQVAPPASAPLLRDISAGVPAELLVNRPDIRAAEQRLRARHADIGAARAAFFPRIALTGVFGSASRDLSDLFSAGQQAWSFSPQLTLPLFDAGRNRANLDLAHLRRDSAVLDYEKAIEDAFREVADALAATETLGREEQARRAQAQASTRALVLAEARYKAGVDDHLRYLDAQRRNFANLSAVIEIQAQRHVALASLFKALGGGWQTEPQAQKEQT